MIVLDCCVIAIEHYVNCLVLRWARNAGKSNFQTANHLYFTPINAVTGDWKSPLLSARINADVIH